MPAVFILFNWLMLFNVNMTLAPRPQAPAKYSNTSLHPYYVSVTQVEYNHQQKTVEISCKIFADDFEMALKKIYNKPVDLSAPGEIQANKALINEYILKRLRLEFDGKPVNPQYVGYEKEGEAVYVYFEASGIDHFKNLVLRNSILQDYTKEQINIVHVIVNGKRQSTKLTHSELTGSFSF